jgi:hypothetical protein
MFVGTESVSMHHHVRFTFSQQDNFISFIGFLKKSGFKILALDENCLKVECRLARHFIRITLKLYKPDISYLNELV